MYPEIYVLRHGQTVWNLEGRFQGQKDSPLTDKGLAQAARQGAILTATALPPDVRLFASPIERARKTAEIACAGLDGPVIEDARLVEVGFGAWEGLTRADIAAKWPERAESDDTGFLWHFSAPGGESFDRMKARAADVLNDLDGPAVIVTHGITSRMIRGIWLGLDAHGMDELPGGQGCVYHLKDGVQRCYD